MSKFKIYDENDNFIGEYIGDFVEDMEGARAEMLGCFFYCHIMCMVLLSEINKKSIRLKKIPNKLR